MTCHGEAKQSKKSEKEDNCVNAHQISCLSYRAYTGRAKTQLQSAYHSVVQAGGSKHTAWTALISLDNKTTQMLEGMPLN
jgi:hypothetical protein